MGRSKDIQNLVQGLISEPSEPLRKADEEGNVAPEVVEALDITPEMEEQLNHVRKARVGRPKKGTTAESRPNETRATFIVDERLLKKFKYISLADGRLLKDIVAEAMSGYIEVWEETNGKIKLPKAKN